MTTEHQFRKRLDSLLEGIQIIDYNWRYIYLNNVMIVQARMPKEELLGFTMMEKYPGIEQTPMFKILQKCMSDRKPRRLENKFIYPDQTVRWFDLSIEPAEEGLCILSLDITQHKEYEARINKGKNLYAFLSHINQSIVHIKSEKELFKNACKIATYYGGFKMAWIGLFDAYYTSITLVEQTGIKKTELGLFKNALLSGQCPTKHVLASNQHYLCNDMGTLAYEPLKTFVQANGIQSFIVIPLHKSGKIVGTFSFYSDKKDFMGPEEIKLLVEISSDISFALDNYEKERMHRETELLVLENEKRFRALIEKSTDMKTLASHDGKLLYGSPSISQTLGYDRANMRLASVYDFIHPDDLEAFTQNRKRISKKPGASFDFEMRMKHEKGHWVWTEGTVTNMLEESGVHALVSNFRDISEKKKTEQQIEFDRNNTEALINNTADLMWSVDKNLRLITSNRAFDEASAKIYGKKLLLGQKLLDDSLPPKIKKKYIHYYKKALAGESFRETIRLTETEGNWAEIAFCPIIKGPEIVGVACHSHDITARIHSEKRLENQNRELLKTNFELDRFVYSVSHDLRSPLTSVLGLLAFMEEETAEPETLQHVQMIRSRIHRLDDFIKNILNYSRNNRTELEIQMVPVEKIILETVSSLADIKQAKNIEFKISCDDQVPFCTDLLSFKTVVENIISNAIKFTAKSRSKPYIRIKAKTDSKKLSLVIEDNGIGIPQKHQDKIFDMFFRASADTEGSGIGLYIVREIVEKLGGTITVKSEENKKTAFTITLKNFNP
ncbi:PAS domain S-box protein [Flavobacterium sp.]|uniref:PAS domain S-box protein n=1 Tax=Flavobacterium sp. TaxID=239 RepID=UPI0039E4C5DD